MEKYKKNEFCKDIQCHYYDVECSARPPFMCPYSAKAFHRWLKDHGYIIIKFERELEKNNEM